LYVWCCARDSRCPLVPYTTLFRSSHVTDFEVKSGLEKNYFSENGVDRSRFTQWGIKVQLESIDDRLNEWERLDSAGYSLPYDPRSEEHTSELQSRFDLVCRLLLEK